MTGRNVEVLKIEELRNITSIQFQWSTKGYPISTAKCCRTCSREAHCTLCECVRVRLWSLICPHREHSRHVLLSWRHVRGKFIGIWYGWAVSSQEPTNRLHNPLLFAVLFSEIIVWMDQIDSGLSLLGWRLQHEHLLAQLVSFSKLDKQTSTGDNGNYTKPRGHWHHLRLLTTVLVCTPRIRGLRWQPCCQLWKINHSKWHQFRSTSNLNVPFPLPKYDKFMF